MRNPTILFLLFSLQLSCTPKKSAPSFELGISELTNLLSQLDPELQNGINHHVIYSEILNDSTAEIQIYRSKVILSRDYEGVKKVSIGKKNVFIYSFSNNSELVDSDLKEEMNRFLFIADLPFWHLLIKRRENIILTQVINHFIPRNSKIPKEDLENDLGGF